MTAEQLDKAMTAQDANPGVKANPRPQPGAANALGEVIASIMKATGQTELVYETAPARVRRIDPAIPAAYQGPPKALLERAPFRLRRAVEAVAADVRYGALFLGPSGCGKSSAAAWAVRRWRAHNGPNADMAGTVAWLDALEATDAERRYRLGSGDPEDLAEAYRADWLVLDDVGLTCSATLVQLVLARRYQACLPTIVTTGLERGQLVQHIGAATVRRIVEFEGRAGVMVDCHGGVT